MPKKRAEVAPDRLVRERAGSYLTEDGRFRVRSDTGGAWYVVDTQRANELGLELLLGPLPTIAAARAALASQREQPAGFGPGELPEPAPSRDRGGDAPKQGPTNAREPEPEPERPKPALWRADWRSRGDDRDAVAVAFRRINDAWTVGRPEQMADVLHERVVMVQPGFADRVAGREAAIASFREFMEASQVHEYAESDLVINVEGPTAVLSCRWEIDWTSGERRQRERGHDVYVFARDGERWRAVWRLIVPEGG